MLLYEVPNIIKIFYEKENELIIHEWLEYNPEDQDNAILLILQEIYELHLTYPVNKLIVKTDLTKGAFSPTIQEYINDVQFPRLLADTKLRYVVTIKSDDIMKAMASTLWQGLLNKKGNIVLHNVQNEKEAREWLKTIVE